MISKRPVEIQPFQTLVVVMLETKVAGAVSLEIPGKHEEKQRSFQALCYLRTLRPG